MSALGLGQDKTLVTGLGVDHIGLARDESVLDQLADVLSGVGVADLGGLVGVHPHLPLAAREHGRGQPEIRNDGGWRNVVREITTE